MRVKHGIVTIFSFFFTLNLILIGFFTLRLIIMETVNNLLFSAASFCKKKNKLEFIVIDALIFAPSLKEKNLVLLTTFFLWVFAVDRNKKLRLFRDKVQRAD